MSTRLPRRVHDHSMLGMLDPSSPVWASTASPNPALSRRPQPNAVQSRSTQLISEKHDPYHSSQPKSRQAGSEMATRRPPRPHAASGRPSLSSQETLEMPKSLFLMQEIGDFLFLACIVSWVFETAREATPVQPSPAQRCPTLITYPAQTRPFHLNPVWLDPTKPSPAQPSVPRPNSVRRQPVQP